jgi:putative endopeptidase
LDLGLTPLTYLYDGPNKENPMINDAIVVSDIRTLPERSYYQNKELIQEFKSILVDFFNTIKMDNPEQRAQWVIDFETKLAMKAPLPKDIRGRFSEKRDIKREDFLKKYPELKFERANQLIPTNTVLIDLIPETNEFINNALKNEPTEVLKSVYAFHSMNEYMDDAYPEFFNKYFKFKNKYLGGPAERADRQERCTKLVMNQFGMELDYELINILFPNFPQDRAIKAGEAVRNSILKGLESNTWLSEATKKEAINKIKFAKLHLVKPQKDSDWDFMPIKKYSKDKPYANAQAYGQASFEKLMSDLKEQRNLDKWGMSPLVVNAYYSPPDNKFVLPQGILQFPFFSEKLSDAENIAAIGTIVGHELGHGIDDNGSEYDYTGKVRKWFTDKDLKHFKERGEKFVTQFDKMGHDGKLTLGENIGDHVGLTFSYLAAYPEPEKASEDDKQKFFISYARMWCGVATPSYIEKQLKTDPHAIGSARINQQVIHSSGFQEAFGCKPGDKMFLDAKDRIRVW